MRVSKTLSLSLSLAAVLVLAAACAAPAAPPAAAPAPAQPTQAPAPTTAPAPPTQAPAPTSAPAVAAFQFPSEPVTIEVWWHEYAPFSAYMKELIEGYKKVRPNVTVNATVASQADLNQKLTAALASGTGPEVIDQDASYFLSYHSRGVLDPVNLEVFGVKTYAELAAKYTPGGLDAATFDGKVYALPFQGNSFSLFVNNKLFAAAGLDPQKDAPKTWSDLMTICPKLKKVEGTRTVQKAFDFAYMSPRWQLLEFQPLLEQFGGKVLSDDGKTAYLNSPEAVKALSLWRDVTKACGDPKVTMNTASDTNRDFLDGRTAMWITGPWATPQIQGAFKNEFTVVSLPQVDPAKPKTILYGFMWGVNKAKPDKQKLVAWDFIKFMVAKPDEWLTKAGFVQPVKGLLETEAAKTIPYLDVHMKDVASGSWYVRSPQTNEIAQAVGRAIDRVVFDGADPKASLDTAQAEVDKILQK